MDMQRILLVDDEASIAQVLEQRLRRDGFEVAVATDGASALALLAELHPAVAVLDLGLPDIDGLEVLRQWRASGSQVPVIILTARGDEVDRVVGLELGADDYVTKPFSPRELVARIRALLRRTAAVEALRAQVAAQNSVSDMQLDLARRIARFRRQTLDLRPREFDLLAVLATHPGQVWTREALLRQVWGSDEFIDARTVDVHIRRLRAKLSDVDPQADPIQTEWGVGYRWIEG
jgi:DNA-binding response OmpR family regulator